MRQLLISVKGRDVLISLFRRRCKLSSFLTLVGGDDGGVDMSVPWRLFVGRLAGGGGLLLLLKTYLPEAFPKSHPEISRN